MLAGKTCWSYQLSNLSMVMQVATQPTLSYFSRKAYRQTSNLELQTFLNPPLKYWTAQELIFCPQHDWLEPPQWRPGEGPRAWGLQMTDHHAKHHLTSVCTLPYHHITKGRSCDIQDQEQMTPAGPWCPWAVQAGLLTPLTFAGIA